MPPKYIKRIGTCYPLVFTEGLWARGDMIPCDEDGNSLRADIEDEPAVLPSATPAVGAEPAPEAAPETDDRPDVERLERIEKIIAVIPGLKPEDYRKGAVPMPRLEPLIILTGDETISLDEVREAWARHKKAGGKKDAGSEL
jgi:hypothetical protein